VLYLTVFSCGDVLMFTIAVLNHQPVTLDHGMVVKAVVS